MKERVVLNRIEGLNTTAIPHTKAPFQPYVLSATSGMRLLDQNWTALVSALALLSPELSFRSAFSHNFSSGTSRTFGGDLRTVAGILQVAKLINAFIEARSKLQYI